MADSDTMEARQKIAVALAAVLGVSGCVTVFSIATRTDNAAQTAKASGQRRYAENLQNFADDFNENIGGLINGIMFMILLTAIAVGYFYSDKRGEGWTAARFFMALAAGVYTIVMSILVWGACLDTDNLDNCGDSAVSDANPYVSCRLQEDLREELDTVLCPSIQVYAAVSSVAWTMVCISKGFEWYKHGSGTNKRLRSTRKRQDVFLNPTYEGSQSSEELLDRLDNLLPTEGASQARGLVF